MEDKKMTYTYRPGLGLQIIQDTNMHQLAAVSDAFYEIRIQNRLHDNSFNASNGNPIVIGTREQPIYELASGDELKLYEIAPMNLYFQQIASGTPTGFVVIAFIASGKV